MTYTRLAQPPQTGWARHLDAVRRDRNWSATQMFEDAREALGLAPKSRAAFTPLLIDDEPNERQAKALAQLYGMPEPEPERTPQPDQDATSSLLERQVRAAERQAAAAEEANRLQADQNDLLRLMLLRDQLPEDHWDEMRARGLEWTDAAVARLLTPPTSDPRPAQVG